MNFTYLFHIFQCLKKPNLQLKDKGNNKLDGAENIFVFEDKLCAFIFKIDLWIS